MEYQFENGILTVTLPERVDTANAETVGTQIDEICRQCAEPITGLIFDAAALQYISSAGLRVVLRFRKAYPTLKVINVCAEVYDVFDMTGFTEMITVEKAYRQFSVEGCPVIGEGAKGTVYRYDSDIIVKVYKSLDSLPAIRRERELARKAFVLGIPTAISYDIVKVGDRFGSVFELLDAKSFSQLIREEPERFSEYVAIVADLLRRIHTTTVRAEDMPDVKGTVNQWVSTAIPFLSAGTAEKLTALVRDVPDTLNMLHCDFHTNNIMMQNGEAILIDMDTLSHGHPVFELANVYIAYVGFGEADPTLVENFIGFSYENTKKFWNLFLPAYLETEDPARIADVERKVRLLSEVRLMRHFVRRGAASTEEGKKTIAHCVQEIEALTASVDTLDF